MTPADRQPAVTFRNLGAYGRLGNQLWQLAAVAGLAATRNMPVRLPPWRYEQAFSIPGDLFGNVSEEDVDAPDLAEEVSSARGKATPWASTSGRLFLQDTTLWWEHRDLVRKLLTPSDASVQLAQRLYGDVLSAGEVTAVHVRRTDYLLHDRVYRQLTPDYYAEALQDRRGPLIVFSDDPAWVRAELAFLEPDVVSDGPPDFVDLTCMSLCARHVIANSSFSWWGAFLSGSTAVSYPATWYTPDFAHLQAAGLLAPNWPADRGL